MLEPLKSFREPDIEGAEPRRPEERWEHSARAWFSGDRDSLQGCSPQLLHELRGDPVGADERWQPKYVQVQVPEHSGGVGSRRALSAMCRGSTEGWGGVHGLEREQPSVAGWPWACNSNIRNRVYLYQYFPK